MVHDSSKKDINQKWVERAPIGILIVTLLLTFFVWRFVVNSIEVNRAARFDQEVSRINNAISNRANLYINALRSGNGLFAASNEVDREEWAAFVESIDLQEHFPGIQGFGFSEYVPREEKEAFEARIQAQGYPDFTIRPEGSRDEYTAIIYLEPFDIRNQQAFGFDMFSEVTRREAMSQARDTGEAVLSGRVTLVQEIDEDVQAGFLIYLPTYKNGVEVDTLEARREALIGYVYSPFRAVDFMEGILGDQIKDDLNFAVFDGEGPLRKENLMFDSKVVENKQNTPVLETEDYFLQRDQVIEVGNHAWSIRYVASDNFAYDKVQYLISWAVLILGVMVSLALTSFFSTQVNSRRKAIQLANSMTRDLMKKTKENEQIRKEVEEANKVLQEKSDALQKKIDDIEKVNKVMVSRENKMIELKEEIKELKKKIE